MKTVFGKLAGNVGGLYRAPEPEWMCYTVWGCTDCGEGIVEGEKCLACIVYDNDIQLVCERLDEMLLEMQDGKKNGRRRAVRGAIQARAKYKRGRKGRAGVQRKPR